jgi:hypothetical protein
MIVPNFHCDDLTDLELNGRSAKLRQRLISQLAYQNWLARGAPIGSALRDWLDAEKDVDEGEHHRATRRRAFDIWQEKGCPSASALADWLEAERDIGEKAEIAWSDQHRRTDIARDFALDGQMSGAELI